jgi:hypothetical protein
MMADMQYLNRSHLRAWQREAVARAAKESVLIAAAPGAGKAITKLTAIADGITSGKFRRVLLVAPRLILDTVLEPEARRWAHTAHLTFAPAHRFGGAERIRCWFERPSQITTCTPDLLAGLVSIISQRATVPFDAVFVDEAQAFKAPDSVRTKALHALTHVVPHIVLASGTPTPNGSIDAWSPGRLVAPGNVFWDVRFHTWAGKHFDPKGPFGFRPKAGAEERIRRELAKSALAIRLQDATDIPPELYLTQPFEHPAGHKRLIAHFLRDRSVTVAGEAFEGSGDDGDGGFLTRLHELTNGFAYLSGGRTEVLSMARVEALKDIVESSDGPVLVGIKFKADAMMIRRVFPQAEVYAGGIGTSERVDIIRRWNDDNIPLLLGNPASMGHGLNLQHGSARTLVWYSTPFSWELYCQMNARLVRGGQRKVVSVIRLQSDVGLDAAIASVLARKGAGERALMDALDVRKKAAR